MSPILRTILLPVVLLPALIGCNEGEERTCPLGSSAPTADTLIGARIDGTSVLIPPGGSWSGAFFSPAGRSDLNVIGWDRAGFPAEVLQLSIRNFHGVGSYPIGYMSPPGAAFAVYGCVYPGVGDHTSVSFWPVDSALEGDSAWVTSWDSVTGRLQGTFSFHAYHPDDLHVVPITDGTFDAIVQK
jgi:hypothetical protein